MKRPVVLVVTRRTSRKHKFIDYVGEFHLQLLIRVRTLPVMVPVVEGTEACLPQYVEEMRGLLLVEGEDIEPKRYDHDESNLRYLEKTHPLKDDIEVRLARHALRNDLPILGICRGSQLLNVIYGGSLYGDVQKEKQSDLKHINYGDHYDEYRHLSPYRSRHASRRLVSAPDAQSEQLSPSGRPPARSTFASSWRMPKTV